MSVAGVPAPWPGQTAEGRNGQEPLRALLNATCVQRVWPALARPALATAAASAHSSSRPPLPDSLWIPTRGMRALLRRERGERRGRSSEAARHMPRFANGWPWKHMACKQVQLPTGQKSGHTRNLFSEASSCWNSCPVFIYIYIYIYTAVAGSCRLARGSAPGHGQECPEARCAAPCAPASGANREVRARGFVWRQRHRRFCASTPRHLRRSAFTGRNSPWPLPCGISAALAPRGLSPLGCLTAPHARRSRQTMCGAQQRGPCAQFVRGQRMHMRHGRRRQGRAAEFHRGLRLACC